MIDMRWVLLIASLWSGALSAAPKAARSECELRLVQSYAGLTKIAVEQGDVSLARIQALAAQDKPGNPYPPGGLTNDQRIISQKISELARRTSPAQWNLIRQEILDLVKQIQGDNENKEVSTTTTAWVLNPKAIGEVKMLWPYRRISWQAGDKPVLILEGMEMKSMKSRKPVGVTVIDQPYLALEKNPADGAFDEKKSTFLFVDSEQIKKQGCGHLYSQQSAYLPDGEQVYATVCLINDIVSLVVFRESHGGKAISVFPHPNFPRFKKPSDPHWLIVDQDRVMIFFEGMIFQAFAPGSPPIPLPKPEPRESDGKLFKVRPPPTRDLRIWPLEPAIKDMGDGRVIMARPLGNQAEDYIQLIDLYEKTGP